MENNIGNVLVQKRTVLNVMYGRAKSTVELSFGKRWECD